MAGYIITGVVGVALIAITVLLLTGHGANLIAGFNTMPKEHKERFDKAALCKFVGNILIPIEVALFICIVGGMLNAPWTTWAAIILGVFSFPYVVGVTIYANTGNRFKL